MTLDNKVVLITGAGSGIGQAIALHFAKLSTKLSLLDINAEYLEKVVEECDNLNKNKALKIITDVTNDEAVKEAIDSTVAKLGGIDILVNCAGTIKLVGILDHDFISCFDKVIKLNLRSYAVVTHYASKALIKSKGCIINIASMSGKTVDKHFIPYGASKAAIIHFTKNAALELADKGVRVNSISPGSVATKFLTNSGLSEESISKVRRRRKEAPLKNILQAEEIADLAGYLASDKAKSITGADFLIDSGRSLTGSLLNDNEV